jgi:soluble lytic murein transglycosylase-like protein
MKTTPIDQEKRKADAPGITALLSQYAQSQFHTTLSQFEKATLPEESPLNGLLNLQFTNSPTAVAMPENLANLSTQPLAAPDLSGVRKQDLNVAATPKQNDSLESLASLQSQGILTSVPPESTAKFQDIVQEASQAHNVPVALINAVIKQESGFNPGAQSPVGAQGLMQLMPATAKAYGCSNSMDARQNVMAGTRFLGDLLKMYKGDVELALAGYNAGPGNVAKFGNQVPPFKETQNYVAKVQTFYQSNMAAMDRTTARFAQNQEMPQQNNPLKG